LKILESEPEIPELENAEPKIEENENAEPET
jgi:hypothetical protein